jgi:hypothetical protein
MICVKKRGVHGFKHKKFPLTNPAFRCYTYGSFINKCVEEKSTLYAVSERNVKAESILTKQQPKTTSEWA